MSQHIIDLIAVSQENLTTLGADYASHILRNGGMYAGYITAAVAATVFYSIYDKFTVPRQLSHIPSVPFSKYGAVLWRGEDIDTAQKQLYLPAYGEHGLLVRMINGKWAISIANPEYAKKMLMRLETFPKVEMFKSDAEQSGLTAHLLGRSNIVFQNGEHWKRHRKIANPAFHRSMPVQLFGTLTQSLFKKFEAEGNRIDVHDYMQRFTLDAIGKAGFGFDFQSIGDAGSKWAKIYNDVMAGTASPIFAIFPVLEQRFLWALPHRRSLHQKMDQLNELFVKVIEKKKQVIQQEGYSGNSEIEHEKDLLTLMIEANLTEEEGKGLSDSELRDNLAIFFIAGHDTTANALSSAIYYLAANKDCQQKAREEAIAILGDAPEDILPDIEQTKQFKYINQVMKETMRLAPPASGVVSRQTTDDVELGPYIIPKGSLVTIDIYSMHHSPQNWTDPDRFDPERFADNGENEAKMGSGNGASYAWIPFSNGARQCIGMNFSLAEQRVVLSMLLRKYEWSLPVDSIHRDGLKLDPSNHSILGPINLIADFHPRY